MCLSRCTCAPSQTRVKEECASMCKSGDNCLSVNGFGLGFQHFCTGKCAYMSLCLCIFVCKCVHKRPCRFHTASHSLSWLHAAQNLRVSSELAQCIEKATVMPPGFERREFAVGAHVDMCVLWQIFGCTSIADCRICFSFDNFSRLT